MTDDHHREVQECIDNLKSKDREVLRTTLFKLEKLKDV
jgi:hypothetical protein